MKIIIVGVGKVGRTIARELIEEGHDVTLVDKNKAILMEVCNTLDCLGVPGDGADMRVLNEAGIKNAEVLLAVTASDEVNLLCCLFAKKECNIKTIARVRNRLYNDQIGSIREELGLALSINPEISAAKEIDRLLKIPSAIGIDTFEGGKVDILSFIVDENSRLIGKKIMESPSLSGKDVLVVGIERGDEAIIPNGHTVIEKGDKLSVCIALSKIKTFFYSIGIPGSKIKKVMIIGGSSIAEYLCSMLNESDIQCTLIEEDKKRCEELAEKLPLTNIVCGDATDETVLEEEGINDYDAFVSLTGLDEENIILSLYASSKKDMKVITKINRIHYDKLVNNLGLGSIIIPKQITSEYIIRFVRAMDSSSDNEIESLYQMLNGKAEAISFRIKEESEVTGKTLLDMTLKKNLLIGAIIRKGKVITPSGKDILKVGDTVIIITTHLGLNNISDILA